MTESTPGAPATSVHPVDRVHKPPHSFSGPSRSASISLNPRSCVTCRRRKVRCDKGHPCANCTKAHIDCFFPAPGRAPRKPRKPPDGELLARLRRLEGVVQSLGISTDDDGRPPLDAVNRAERKSSEQSVPSTGSEKGRESIVERAADHIHASLGYDFGRLVIADGRSRYVNSTFWANLSNEVENLNCIMHESSDEEEDTPSPGSVGPSTSSHQGFMFNHSTHTVDLHPLHPPPEVNVEYWNIYEKNCDPLVKMLHLPTMRDQIYALKDNPDRSKAMEVLLFAIYYGAITSLTDEECLETSGETRPVLQSRYRFGIEQGLAKASFLVTEDIIVLQAFILYLMCLRRHADARFVWTLCGLAIRIAITMGLHLDGTNFGLSALDVEIRRRTWWQACILDIRTSEDHGCDPTMVEHTYDTEFPLNINDEDINSSMNELPVERVGVTESTFSLIRFEVAITFRRLHFQQPLTGFHGSFAEAKNISLEDKERCVEQCHQRLEEKYLRHCDMSKPLHWVICTVARLIMAKMWLVIYHPYQRIDGGASMPQETKDRLLLTSMESIEYAVLLETEARTLKWGWLFKTYTQWHALAFLLSALCTRTEGPIVERAWLAIDKGVALWGRNTADQKRSHLWRPLRKLMATARAARARHFAVMGEPASLEGLGGFVGFRRDNRTSMMSSCGEGSVNVAAKVPQSSRASEISELAKSNSSQSLTASPTAAGTDCDANTNTANSFGGFPMNNSFFANPSEPEQSQWNNMASLSNNNMFLGNDWLVNSKVGSNDIPPTVGCELGAYTIDPGFASGGLLSLESPIDDGAVFDSSQLNFDVDPMVSGADGAEVEWSDWDDMVRQFELQTSNIQASGLNQWQRGRPVIGETWL